MGIASSTQRRRNNNVTRPLEWGGNVVGRLLANLDVNINDNVNNNVNNVNKKKNNVNRKAFSQSSQFRRTLCRYQPNKNSWKCNVQTGRVRLREPEGWNDVNGSAAR